MKILRHRHTHIHSKPGTTVQNLNVTFNRQSSDNPAEISLLSLNEHTPTHSVYVTADTQMVQCNLVFKLTFILSPLQEHKHGDTINTPSAGRNTRRYFRDILIHGSNYSNEKRNEKQKVIKQKRI